MHKKLITALSLSAIALPLVATSTVFAEDTNHEKGSTATLTVKKDNTAASLVLVQVPSFNFGDVNAGKILGGGEQTITGDKNLKITDQRESKKDWTLQVKGTTLSGNGKEISNAKLNITSNSPNLSIENIGLNGSVGVQADGSNTFDAPLEGKIAFEANPTLDLSTSDSFSSALTWTLTTTTGSTPAL